MYRLLFLLLVVAVARPAVAQKIIEKTAPVTPGQNHSRRDGSRAAIARPTARSCGVNR